MKRPTVFGLVGAGGIGAYHRASIDRLERKGLAKLVAVADPTLPRQGIEKSDLEAKGIRWFPECQDMLTLEAGLQAVAIATPIPYHYEMALACLQRDLFVVLEKPPAPLLSQLDALIAADVRHRVRVGFQMIGSHTFQELKRLILAGHLGDIREIRTAACWPRLDGYYQRANWAGRLTLGGRAVFDGPATNALAHLVNGICFLAGQTMTHFAEPASVEAELYRARPIESYDTVCLRGLFPSNIEFSLAATHSTRESLLMQIEVRGSKGWARISEDGAVLETSHGVSLNSLESTQLLLDRYYDQIVHLMEGKPIDFPPTLADTRGYVTATNAMFRSSGGISDIDPAAVEKYSHAGDEGYEVQGLAAAIKASLVTGKLFSEQKLSWAHAQPTTIRLDEMSSLSLSDLEPTPVESRELHAVQS